MSESEQARPSELPGDTSAETKREPSVENPYARSVDSFQEPPKTFLAMLKHLEELGVIDAMLAHL